MTKIRSDHKTNRNQKIYDEYINSDVSYEKLSIKYGVSRQRIMFIINDIKSKGLGESLSQSASKVEREKFKSLAVEIREQGKVKIALDMFNQIINWDEVNNNLKGHLDALGHKKICLTLLADTEPINSKKVELLQNSVDTINLAITIGKDNSLPASTLAIQYVHLGTIYLKQAELSKKENKKKYLLEAKKALEKSLEDLPGSKAHRAWPMRALGLTYYSLGNLDKALETLTKAELNIIKGYENEIKSGDQARIKIKVWESGIKLAFAEIMYLEQKYLLAEMYAASVIAIPDQDNILIARKREAKELLKKINNA